MNAKERLCKSLKDDILKEMKIPSTDEESIKQIEFEQELLDFLKDYCFNKEQMLDLVELIFSDGEEGITIFGNRGINLRTYIHFKLWDHICGYLFEDDSNKIERNKLTVDEKNFLRTFSVYKAYGIMVYRILLNRSEPIDENKLEEEVRRKLDPIRRLGLFKNAQMMEWTAPPIFHTTLQTLEDWNIIVKNSVRDIRLAPNAHDMIQTVTGKGCIEKFLPIVDLFDLYINPSALELERGLKEQMEWKRSDTERRA